MLRESLENFDWLRSSITLGTAGDPSTGLRESIGLTRASERDISLMRRGSYLRPEFIVGDSLNFRGSSATMPEHSPLLAPIHSLKLYGYSRVSKIFLDM